MTFFDHLLMFSDSAAAVAALAPIGYYPEGAWPACAVSVSVSIETPDGPAPIPGFFIALVLDAVDQHLVALPDGACRIVFDRAAFEAQDGTPYFAHLAADLDVALLRSARVEPVFAGSEYPFGD